MSVRPFLAATAALALAGCGAAEPVPADVDLAASAPALAGAATRTDLAARAAAAQDLTAVSFYQFTTAAGAEHAVMLVRARDGSWRVDIAGGALGGQVDVAIVGHPDGLLHCALADPPGRAGCVAVEQLAAEADPQVQHVFTDWLEVFTNRAAAVAVAAAPVPADPPARAQAGGVACFAVQSSAASLLAPVSPGVYCFASDGTLTAAELELGTLRLVSTSATAPETVDLPGPVTAGDPLPVAGPTASPEPDDDGD